MMKLIPTEQAVGHVLCHDMTRIVKGVSKGPAFRKGHIVTPEDIPRANRIMLLTAALAWAIFCVLPLGLMFLL